jgi:hypothetical protein
MGRFSSSEENAAGGITGLFAVENWVIHELLFGFQAQTN